MFVFTNNFQLSIHTCSQITLMLALLSSLFIKEKCKRIGHVGNTKKYCVYPLDIVFCAIIILLLVPQVIVVSALSLSLSYYNLPQQLTAFLLNSHFTWPLNILPDLNLLISTMTTKIFLMQLFYFLFLFFPLHICDVSLLSCDLRPQRDHKLS